VNLSTNSAKQKVPTGLEDKRVGEIVRLLSKTQHITVENKGLGGRVVAGVAPDHGVPEKRVL